MFRVVLPAAAPQIVAGLRNSLQVAIILMVVSEWEASTDGIGYYIVNAQQSFDYVGMWSGIIVLAIIGTVANLLFVAVENRVCTGITAPAPWKETDESVKSWPRRPPPSCRCGSAEGLPERGGAEVGAAGHHVRRGARRVRLRGRAERRGQDHAAAHAWPGWPQPTRARRSSRARRCAPCRAGIGVVFQDYGRSLYPWLTVARNVELPLRVRGVRRAERAQRVAEVLASVGLADAGRSYPWQLSGGMQQRVAIARALAYRPDLLLMDEPFASVDAQTRFELEDLILRVRQEFGVTVVFVTHDIDEAVYLADRVIAISKSPGVVTEIVDITLARPRDQITTKADPAFARYREHLLGLVMTRPASPA